MNLTGYLQSFRESVRSYRGAMMVYFQSMGFWRGRQFRVYSRITANTQFRFTCTRDFLLTAQSLYCDDGRVEVQILTGSTPSGVWTAIPTVNAKNRIGMSPVPLNTPEVGGSFTGGTERELIMSDSGAGQGIGLGNILLGDRGLPAGTYFFQATVMGATVNALYSFEWEELDTVAGVPVSVT